MKVSLLVVLTLIEIKEIYNCEQKNFSISSHVLDTNKGLPASGVLVQFYKLNNNNEWTEILTG